MTILSADVWHGVGIQQGGGECSRVSSLQSKLRALSNPQCYAALLYYTHDSYWVQQSYGLYKKAEFDPSVHKFYPNQLEFQVWDSALCTACICEIDLRIQLNFYMAWMEQSLCPSFLVRNINFTFPPQPVRWLNCLFMQMTGLMKINFP